MSGAPEDFDLLAAEYVLGVLDAAESEAVLALAAREDALATAIEAWQNRLAPLAALADPVPPPADLWARLAASAGLTPERTATPETPAAQASTVVPLKRSERPAAQGGLWRSPALWRATTAGALALAAAFAGIAFLSRPAPRPDYVAALAPQNAPAPGFLAESDAEGGITIRPLAHVTVEPGKDLELWALPKGAVKPVSLGVIPPIGRHLRPGDMPREATQLMVSLEPLGGSPTGVPTGPVLFAGTLTRVD